MTTSRPPRIFTYPMDIRFGDLDPYGHVNAARYLDLVISSRLLFMERSLRLSMAVLIQRKLGFYLRQATQNFMRPIIGQQTVMCSSLATAVEGARVTVAYKIASIDGETIFSDGAMEFAFIDLATQRKCNMPEWLEPYLYEDGEI